MGVVLYVIGAYLILVIIGLNKIKGQTPTVQTEETISVVDQSCKTINNTIGICTEFLKCPVYKSCGDEEGCDLDIADYMMTSSCKINNNSTAQLFCCPTTTTTTRTINQVVARKTIKLLPIPIEECGGEPALTDRILYGKTIDFGEFTWMALIIYKSIIVNKKIYVNTTNESISNHTAADTDQREFKCGGNLINERYVLTAAHCVAGNVLKKYTPQSVRLGEYDVSSNIDCDKANQCADPPVDVKIEEIIVHEYFNRISETSNFDIALIRLNENVKSTAFIQPICLPQEENEKEEDNENYENINDCETFVAGWGLTENGTFSNIKLRAMISLTNRSNCKQAYQHYGAFENQLCGLGENGADSCSGDSGGGLMVKKTLENFDGYWYIIGIVSFGPSPCGRINIPGVYTPVKKYMRWIREHLNP